MFSKVKYRTWKNYSGPMIRGSKKFNLPAESSHWDRVIWLTSKVETGGNFDSITMYDGAGVSAGISQCISVYPREIAHEDNNPEDDQGSLWCLLTWIRTNCPELLERLEIELREVGWEIEEGFLWHTEINELVNGRKIREEFTPNQGKVPRWGQAWQESKNWALTFHDIFSDPRSFDIQIDFAIEHAQRTSRRKPKVLRGKTVESMVYRGDARDTKLFSREDPMDLAMAIFFSNSVNAPAMAFRKLKEARDKFGRRFNPQNANHRKEFAWNLIRAFGNANYARWNFKIASGRYQRTRKAAMEVWPKEFFLGPYAFMPAKL